jgi:hypothetical protein
VLLLAYWFRYTCLLIVSAKTVRDFAAEVAAANQMSFLEVQAALREAAPAELDQLNATLERDYALITNLIGNAGDSESSVEDRMLQMNYRLARTLYKTVGRFSPDVARHALDEMSVVISHFANAMGERATMGAGA